MKFLFFVITISGLIFQSSFSTIIPSFNRTKTNNFIVEPPTLVCAGFEWYISGDQNRNAHVEVKYRKKGADQWLEAMPLLRIGGEKVYGHEQRWVYTTENMFAGSIFNLQESTWYECKFSLSDEDGIEGDSEKIVTIKTKSEPRPYEHGQVYHVYPPGYKGERMSPSFTGLNAAYYGEGNTGDWWNVPDARVQPGDVILVHAGLYKANRLQYADPLALDFHGAYVFTQKGTEEKPITIKAAGDGEVIFDGDGSYRLFDVMAGDYHYFEGITIRNTDIAFYAGLKHVMGSKGLVVKNCKFEDIGVAVSTYSEDSKDFYIADNTIIGRHPKDTLIGWAGFEVPERLSSYYAIKVYGQCHVICNNSISYFHDGICVDTHGQPEPGKKCVSIDIYHNDIFNTSDDFIEADGGVHNIRVFENRGFNSYHSAISAQPIFGGPVYFIKNILYHIPGTAMKYTVRPSGIYTLNNTFIANAAIQNFSNGHFRNNLFIGLDDRPVFSATTFTRYSSMDYNGYRISDTNKINYRLRIPLHDTLNNADDREIPMMEFKTLKELNAKTGFESHGIELSENIFEKIILPDPKRKGKIYSIEGNDFRLKAGSKAIDAGCALPNITDGFTGKSPDLGALEFNGVIPWYGVRK
ncbi:MAG: hypothetical protein ABI844_08905 [Saprospiraceae bacterium]